MPHFIALLARACEMAGHIEEAMSLLDKAFQIAEKTGEGWSAAELNHHKGQLLRQGPSEAAEDWYRDALSIAQEQEAKFAASLARFYRDRGRHTEIHDVLAPPYGWFTEGFDTPDLLEVKGCSTRSMRNRLPFWRLQPRWQ
jgi:tetratricopeptide (TPR) repeat protein